MQGIIWARSGLDLVQNMSHHITHGHADPYAIDQTQGLIKLDMTMTFVQISLKLKLTHHVLKPRDKDQPVDPIGRG